MLDPRIYRTSLVAVALALIVVAFSLQDRPAPLTATLVPDAFNGAGTAATLRTLAGSFPSRPPGSPADAQLAALVAGRLSAENYTVTVRSAPARTIDGQRSLTSVIAERPGNGAAQGSIVVVASRDLTGSPGAALSGTAVLLELARDLSGETTRHPLILVSSSGSAGAAGAAHLAARLPGPIDAVLVLGDLAAARPRGPVVLPFSDRAAFAPGMLRDTVGAALTSQAGVAPGGISFVPQLAHLALPISLTEEAPFNARGEPAVELSLSGQHAPRPREALGGASRLGGMGQAVLESIDALDAAGPVPAPAPYLLLKGKIVPPWAVKLLALALLAPVLLVAADGAARARRRGFALASWVGAVVVMALPAAAGLLVVALARTTGALPAAPPGATAPGLIPLGAHGALVLAAALLLVAGVAGLRHRLLALPKVAGESSTWRNAGGAAGLLLVLCATAVAVWVTDPYAALLLVPALHLWAWTLDPDLPLPRPVRVTLWLLGLLPPVLLVAFYALEIGLGPLGVLWNGLLLLAGGRVPALTLIEWCLLLACSAGVAAAAFARSALGDPRPAKLTVRGPASYAGPGSLGGTESAMRR